MSTLTRKRITELTEEVLDEINAQGWRVVEVDGIPVGEVDLKRGGQVTMGELHEWTVTLKNNADSSGAFSFMRTPEGRGRIERCNQKQS